jgi:hypothetical protein
LHDYEQMLAGLIEPGSRLAIATARAQKAMADRLGYLGGHQVLASFSTAQTHVSAAMTSVADGHRKLTRIGAAAGYQLDSEFGDFSKDPKAIMELFLSAVVDEGALRPS